MRYIYLLIYLLFPVLLTAQQKKGIFVAYGPEARYFSNLNFSAYQAANGFLWIGTQNGLVRFDGKRYKNFFSDYSNPNSPSDNSTMDIVEDKNNDLWFTGFFHGVTRYNQSTRRFKKYPRLSQDNNDYYGVYSGLKDSDGDLWFCTSGRGLAKYIYDKDSFALYYPEPAKCRDGSVRGDNYVTAVCEDRYDKNILWCGTFHGLYSFDKRKGTFTYWPETDIMKEQEKSLINTIEIDNRGNLWVGSWDYGLLCFNTLQKKFDKSRAKRDPNVIYHIRQVNDSLLYMAALQRGLWKYNLNTNEFTDITPPGSSGDPSSSNPDIQRISVTPNAGIFIGGNYYLYQQHTAFERLQKNIIYPDRSKPGSERYLTGCVWDKFRKQYWVTTVGGHGVYIIPENLAGIQPAHHPDQDNDALDYFIYPVIDAKQRVWVVNVYNGILQWNESTSSFKKPFPDIPLADSIVREVQRIKTDEAGNIWMTSWRYFIYWDVNKNEASLFPIVWDPAYKNVKSLEGELEIDREGNAWLITLSGLFHCDRQQKKVEQIFQTGHTADDMATAAWASGAFDKYNGLWLTAGNGIQVFDWKTRKVLANHNTDGGLATMKINTIEADSSGKIWAATTAGLSLFDPTKKSWQLFNRYDGLEKDYLDGELFITSNNKVVIDQLDGFIIKDAGAIMTGQKPPLLNITSLLINEKEYADSIVPASLSLDHSENNISIEFAAMDWLYPYKTTYWYRIEGEGFHNSLAKSDDAKLNLTALQPGKYTIHLLALTGSNLWSKEVELSIVIKPPYWKTTGFIVLCSVLLIALLYGIYRYRINRLKELQDMRNSISRNLHDDIGASLSNIRILNEMAKRNAGDPKRSTGYLDTAAEDIQRISESLGDIVWNINPKYDDPVNLFIRMKRYAADMMDGKNIAFSFEFPPTDQGIKLTIDKRRDFYLIFKEAIHNLVKYSEAATASVKVEIQKAGLSLTIRDDGKGFDILETQHGSGLQNMQQRAAALKAKLEIQSALGKGTTIHLFMPV